MKQLTFQQTNNQYGEIEGLLRIDGRILFLKCNNDEYRKQLIDTMVQKGAKIDVSIDKKWIKADIFHSIAKDVPVKLQNEEFYPYTDEKNKIEEALARFYASNFIKSNFIVNMKEVK